MFDIGVIGDYDSICGFSAIGFHIYPVFSAEEAEKKLRSLVKAEYGIIYITEPFMNEISTICERYNNLAIPCIIPVPSCTGTIEYGRERLKRAVEQAVGRDLISGK